MKVLISIDQRASLAAGYEAPASTVVLDVPVTMFDDTIRPGLMTWYDVTSGKFTERNAGYTAGPTLTLPLTPERAAATITTWYTTTREKVNAENAERNAAQEKLNSGCYEDCEAFLADPDARKLTISGYVTSTDLTQRAQVEKDRRILADDTADVAAYIAGGDKWPELRSNTAYQLRDARNAEKERRNKVAAAVRLQAIRTAREYDAKVTVNLSADNVDTRKHGAPFVRVFDTRGEGSFVEEAMKVWGKKSLTMTWEFDALPGDIIQARLSDGSWKNDPKGYYRVGLEGTIESISDKEAAMELTARKKTEAVSRPGGLEQFGQ